MSRLQSFLLLGVFGVVIVGVGLPVGLVAIALESSGGTSIPGAIRHGELWLAAANAAVAGCIALMASGRHNVLSRAIATLFVFALGVIPCYTAWAAIVAHIHLGLDYSKAFAVDGGAVAAGSATLIGLSMVVAAYDPQVYEEVV